MNEQMKQNLIAKYIEARDERNSRLEADESDPERVAAFANFAGVYGAIIALGGDIVEDHKGNVIDIKF